MRNKFNNLNFFYNHNHSMMMMIYGECCFFCLCLFKNIFIRLIFFCYNQHKNICACKFFVVNFYLKSTFFCYHHHFNKHITKKIMFCYWIELLCLWWSFLFKNSKNFLFSLFIWISRVSFCPYDWYSYFFYLLWIRLLMMCVVCVLLLLFINS